MTTAPAPPEILVRDLHMSFGDHRVLQGVNLAVDRGELVAIVGGSGSGKTVLLEHLTGHFRAEPGKVFLADHESPLSPLVDLGELDEAGMDRLRRHWGVVFQRNALFSGTVKQNLSLPLIWVRGLSEHDVVVRISDALRAVALDPDAVLSTDRDQLSGGMAKRVAIARALATDPLLLFYDEPTTGLDPGLACLIQDLILQTHLSARDGFRRTTLIITHDRDLLSRLQPRVVMLHEGRVSFDGTFAAFEASDAPEIRPYVQLMSDLHRTDLPAGARALPSRQFRSASNASGLL